MLTIPENTTVTEQCVEVQMLTSPEVSEERQTIVHCSYVPMYMRADLIRIWPTTYLVDTESGAKTQLLHAFNICLAPFWMRVPPQKIFQFTLIFGGLPKSCKRFNLEEQITEEGGFLVKNIARNDSDVYRVQIS